MKRKSRKKPPVSIQRVNRLLSRMEMALALDQQADGDIDMIHLAQLLRSSSPDAAKCSPHTLAQKIGLPYSRIVEAFKQSKRMETVVAVARHMPEVGEGIAQDAMPKDVLCTACEGKGEVVAGIAEQPQTKLCIPCEGKGKVRQPGDPMARKQVLEMMGLAGQHATPITAPGANILIAGGESLEETLKNIKRGGSNGPDRNAGGSEADQSIARTLSSGNGGHSPS